MNVKTQAQRSAMTKPKAAKSHRGVYLDIAVVIVMCTSLLCGTFWQIYTWDWSFFTIYTDVARYQCYAVSFWHGVSALQSFPAHQCDNVLQPTVQYIHTDAIIHKMQQYHVPEVIIRFVASQSSIMPLHALPREYPFLTIIPFTMSLLGSAEWYEVIFALWMIVVAIIIYWVLIRYKSRKAAIAFTIYLVVGSWATALARFDLIPSALTFFALMCAIHKRWSWSFVLLALATLTKFYPAVLIFPFLLSQQMQANSKWYTWPRWQPLALFVIVGIVITGISFFLSVEGTLGPLTYFKNRPIQVESLQASLVWIYGKLSHHALHYEFTYGSLNLIESSSKLSLLGSLLSLVGPVYVLWLQWRGKVDLATSSLLILLIVMLTGKVFSPQYLIWVAPMIAYVGELRIKWVLPWTAISLLTTFIYPFLYDLQDLQDAPFNRFFFPSTSIRNFLFLGFVIAILVYSARKNMVVPLANESGEAKSAPIAIRRVFIQTSDS